MNRGIIYLILNKQTEQKYVGHTSLAVNKEWAQHIDRSKRMSSEPLHRAFREYGIHNFMIRELDEYDDNSLENKLSSWIDKYKPEYNPIQIIEEEEEEIIPAYTPKQRKVDYYNSHLKPWNENTRSDGKHSGLKIRGKNLETGVCKDYNSAREAALEITGNANKNANILLAARTGRKAYGHRWLILEEKRKKKPVFGVNKKTELIEVRYESIADAMRSLGDSSKGTGLTKSLRNPGRFTWKGYWWFYG
jgi:group I intron endonuclease